MSRKLRARLVLFWNLLPTLTGAVAALGLSVGLYVACSLWFMLGQKFFKHEYEPAAIRAGGQIRLGV